MHNLFGINIAAIRLTLLVNIWLHCLLDKTTRPHCSMFHSTGHSRHETTIINLPTSSAKISCLLSRHRTSISACRNQHLNIRKDSREIKESKPTNPSSQEVTKVHWKLRYGSHFPTTEIFKAIKLNFCPYQCEVLIETSPMQQTVPKSELKRSRTGRSKFA